MKRLETGNVLYYCFSGPITLEDFIRVRAAEEPHFAALPDEPCLGVIVDMGDLDSISPRLFPQLQQMRMVEDRRVSLIAVVGANSYLRVLAISLGIISGRRNLVFHQTSRGLDP
jgi:hypothetical protein